MYSWETQMFVVRKRKWPSWPYVYTVFWPPFFPTQRSLSHSLGERQTGCGKCMLIGPVACRAALSSRMGSSWVPLRVWVNSISQVRSVGFVVDWSQPFFCCCCCCFDFFGALLFWKRIPPGSPPFHQETHHEPRARSRSWEKTELRRITEVLPRLWNDIRA